MINNANQVLLCRLFEPLYTKINKSLRVISWKNCVNREISPAKENYLNIHLLEFQRKMIYNNIIKMFITGIHLKWE